MKAGQVRNRVIDLNKLPAMAQQELVTFYEFLLYKYQGNELPSQRKKLTILNAIFQEADGKLPANYSLNRDESMSDKIFIDINILVYAIADELRKRAISEDILLQEGIMMSPQVIN
jgi:hypothetical protein